VSGKPDKVIRKFMRLREEWEGANPPRCRRGTTQASAEFFKPLFAFRNAMSWRSDAHAISATLWSVPRATKTPAS
jgi:hypothetical protein